MNDHAPIAFSKEELWVLQRVVRHEMGTPWQGKWPITSIPLNDAIADAILLCEDQGQPEAVIILSKGDCYLIDALVPQDAKSPMGVLLGKPILLKTFRVRALLEGAVQATAQGLELSEDELDAALQKWKSIPQKSRRTRKVKQDATS